MSNLDNLSKQDYNKAKKIFNQAIELDVVDINVFISEQCQDNRSLFEVVHSLVSMHQDSKGITINPKQAATSLIQKDYTLNAGHRIDKFVIEKHIGSGGMGDVYLAKRQDQEVHQLVAIKILKNKLNKLAMERFQIEKRVLAHLEHPGIARFIDAGIQDGYTYYVMEYIQGIAIDEYCKNNRLNLKQRLQLFKKVCDVISYAHANLIIHRDLKPGNILVNNEGAIKLVDFGIAKPLQQIPGIDEVPETLEGLFALTPQYAAPEQFSNAVIAVACDIYALGLLLFELLTTLKAQNLKGLSLLEIEKLILNQVPANASKQVLEKKIVVHQFKLRTTQQLSNRLNGDLDSIINHAIKKEPELRYISVNELSQDVNRYLKRQPIEVRGSQIGYKMGKFLKRNWLAATVILGFITILTSSVYFISEERNNAIIEKNVAQEVTLFLMETFKSADPTKTLGTKVTAADILKRGVKQIQLKNPDKQIKNRLLMTLAEVYFNLGDLLESEKLLKQVEKLEDKSTQVDRYLLLADILLSKTNIKTSPQVLEMMHEIEPLLENNSKLKIKVLLKIARAYSVQNDLTKKNEALDEMLALARSMYDEQSVAYVLVLKDYISLDNTYDKAKENLKALKQVDQVLQEKLGVNDLMVAVTQNKIAMIYGFFLYDAKNSLKYAQQAYKIYLNVYGEIFPKRVSLENTIASAYIGLEEYDKALEHFKLGIEMEKNHFSNLPVRIANLEYNMASIYLDHLHDYPKALEYYKKVIPIAAETRGKNSYHYHFKRLNYAKVLGLTGNDMLAEKYLNETIILFEARKLDKKPNTLYVLARAKTFLAQILAKNNELCSAQALILEALPDFITIIGDKDDAYIESKESLTTIKEKLNGKVCTD